MIFTVENIGLSSWFSFWYCFSEIIDYVNNLVGNVMVFKYLEMESRGIVLSLAGAFMSILSAILTYMNGQLNQLYTSAQYTYVQEDHKAIYLSSTDYTKGTHLVMVIGYSMMGAYLFSIYCFRFTHMNEY